MDRGQDMSKVLLVGVYKEEFEEAVKKQFECVNVKEIHKAIEYFGSNKEHIDAVIVGLRMQPLDGIETMEELHRIDPDIPVIISTHETSVPRIVDAMQRGAYNYMYEPRAVQELRFILERALSYMQAIRENRRYQETARKKSGLGRFIGISSEVGSIKHTIERVADSSLPVLFMGESGTGKEVVARALHRLSPREKRPFVAINCGALSTSLLEAELFGYKKGAFTGSADDHGGLFEQAHNGTLFLDEIGLTDMNFQVKLLRVLEDGEIRRIGDNVTRHVDVRIIAATNENLELAVGSNRFREDLFYRLNVITIEIPPLRERREDIPVLAYYFLDEAGKRMPDAPSKISASAIRIFERYDWPGNARELKNVIERAVLLGNKKTIQVSDLPEQLVQNFKIMNTAKEYGLKKSLSDIEAKLIRQALHETNGSRSQAARRLKMKRTTLIEKIKRLGIT